MNVPALLRRGWPALLLLLPFVVPVPGSLERIYVLRSLGVLAHFGLPLLLALLLYRTGPLSGRLTAAAAAAFALAASCELVQSFVGRHPRFEDAGVDLAGVLLLVGWLRWRRSRRPAWLALALLCLAVVPFQLRHVPPTLTAMNRIRERLPVLDDFEDRATDRLWGQNDTKTGSFWISSPPERGDHVMNLSGEPGELYPGVILRGLPRDWSSARRLVFDARCRIGGSAVLTVRLDDFTSRKDALFCGQSVRLGPEWVRCEIDLIAAAARVSGRTFRLDDLDSVLFYLDSPPTALAVQFDNITLE